MLKRTVLIGLLLFTPVGRAFSETGFFAKEVRIEIDNTKATLTANFNGFSENRNELLLENNREVILQFKQTIIDAYKKASEKKLSLSSYNKRDEIAAAIDIEEIKLIDLQEVPALCDQLFKTGQLFLKNGNQKKAKQSFRDILVEFERKDCASCNKKAEFALEDLRDSLGK